ncbi:hypothetical protein PMIN03_011270 [Paraphaeosphaeria minitans]
MYSPNTAMQSLLRCKPRAVPRLPGSKQSLPVTCSRASLFLSSTYAMCVSSSCRRITRIPIVLGHSSRSLEHRIAFTTSSCWRSNQPVEPEKKPLLKTAKLLKAKLPTLKHEQVFNVPNVLTFSRLFATPVIGYLIVNDHHLWAFSLFVYAGFSDLLDGWIARRWNLQTVVGSVIDPMADKFLMTTLVSCLAINGSLSLPLATLILGRDVSLAIAAIYFRYASLPAPKTFARYWDFSLPSAEVHPTTISKLNTFLQLILIGTTMGVALLHDPSAVSSSAGGLLLSLQDTLGGPEGVARMKDVMGGVVAATTTYSGLSYAWMKSAVKILGDDEALKRKQGFRGRMIIAGAFGSVVTLAAALWYREMMKKVEESEKLNETKA